jgi:tRNA-dihydrouridine synthase
MIEGYKLTLGGTEYVVPPLNIKQIRTMKDDIDNLRITNSGDIDSFSNGLRVIQAAMSRNYPEITFEQLEEIIDLGNYKNVVLAIMGQSGLIQKGEAQA